MCDMLKPIIIISIICIVYVQCSFNARRDVEFELHTRDHNTDDFERLVADNFGRASTQYVPTYFDATKPTRIFIHGYMSSRRAFLRYAKAFLKSGNYNFIAVNWLSGSKTYNYMKARKRVERVSLRNNNVAHAH